MLTFSANPKINITFGNGNISTGDINLAATGGWQTWQTFIKKGVVLNKGIQELKLNIIANGCNLNYIQLTRAIPVSVHNNCCNSGFSVYPNPFQSGLLNITSRNLSEPASVFIYSVLGNLVYSAKLSNEKSIQIDRSYLEKGVYLVKYFNKDQFEIVKLLVK